MAEKRREEDRQAMEEALGKTVPSTDFSPEAVRRHLEATAMDQTPEGTAGQYLRRTSTDTHHSTATETAELTRFGETRDLPSSLLESLPGDSVTRFAVEGEVGEGATSKVYAVRDRGLGRTVAVKLLRRRPGRRSASRGRFIHEARVTAKLEHPNIMPVHDIGTTEDGDIYFSMKNIAGSTLGDAIRDAREGRSPHPEFATIDGRVRTMLKVCDGLSFAHDGGYIHQDVKPDNIMIGLHGEVLLLDWGSALAVDDAGEVAGKALFGTPAYMSPEQARRERADVRSDVYCLGATLYHCLTLQHPTWADDPETFWEKKRRGDIDPLPPERRRGVPGALLDIALKAMAPDAGDRYQTVPELADELKRYQAGQAVKAHRETPLEVLVRWYRGNRRLFWIVGSAIVLISVVGWLLFREKIKEWITWQPYYETSFEYASVSEFAEHWEAFASSDWRTVFPEAHTDSSAWRLEDGGVTGHCTEYLHNLTYRTPIPGDIRVEWEVTPVAKPLNLNCYIAGRNRFEGYTFHIGTRSPRSCMMTRGNVLQALESATLAEPVQTGRTYAMRMEKEGKHVRLFIDGHLLFEYRDPEALSGPGHQSFGFENNNANVVRIDNVKVFYHPLPLKVSPLATPDYLFEQGLYVRALELYRSIYRTYPTQDVARWAEYKAARCLQELDSLDQALRMYRQFDVNAGDHELTPRARAERAQLLEQTGQRDSVEVVYRDLAEHYRGHRVLAGILLAMSRPRVRQLDQRREKLGVNPEDYRNLMRWIDTETRYVQHWADAFGMREQPNAFLDLAVQRLIESEFGCHFDSVTARYPAQRTRLSDMLAKLQNLERLEREFPDRRAGLASALELVRDYRRLLEEFPHDPQRCAQALVGLGRFEEVLERYPGQRTECAQALLGKGEYARVLAEYPNQPEACAQALWRMGRLEELIERYPLSGEPVEQAALLSGRHQQLEAALRNSPLALVEFLLYRYHAPDRALQVLLGLNMSGSQAERIGYRVPQALINAGRPGDVFDYTPRVDRAVNAYSCLALFDTLIARYPWNTTSRAEAWQHTGMYDSAHIVVPYNVVRRIESYECAGEYDSLVAAFPWHRYGCARALMLKGDCERVVSEYPDQREPVAYALVKLGRYDEVLNDYPDQRDAGCRALLAQGRIADARERYPDQSYDIAEYLLGLGRYEELVDSYVFRPREYFLSLAHLGRFDMRLLDTATYQLYREDLRELQSLLALKEHIRGRRMRSRRLFRQVSEPHAGSSQMRIRFSAYLLPAILQALEGDTSALMERCRRLRKTHRWHYSQTLYHETGYLLGVVSDDEFLSQPHGWDADVRLPFYRAVRADVLGDTKGARTAYANLQLPLPFMRYTEEDPILLDETVRTFVRWRRVELAPPGAGEQASR